MKTFVEYLMLKSRSVMIDYQLQAGDSTTVELSEVENKLFESMKRWHVNMHMKKADWKSCFERVNHKLDVKEKMEPIREDLRKFLQTKFKAYALKDQFSICEVLEFMESDIRDLYQQKIDQRDEEQGDEFGIDSICRGMDSLDGIYYQKVFMPSAVFFTYLEKHPSARRIELMRDIFSIGSGCRRQENFYPEITGICVECTSTGYFENFSQSDVEEFNRKVFRKQFDSNFGTSFRPSDSDDSDLSDKDDTVEKLGEWYNPFDSSSASQSSDSLDDINVMKFKCKECAKSFSRNDFLEFHTECFHKDNLKSKVIFVADPEDMISSFTKESGPSSSPESGTLNAKVVTSKKPKNVLVELPGKQRIRRSLRFKE